MKVSGHFLEVQEVLGPFMRYGVFVVIECCSDVSVFELELIIIWVHFRGQ